MAWSDDQVIGIYKSTPTVARYQILGSIGRWGACYEQLSVDIANETLGGFDYLVNFKPQLSSPSRPICIS